MSDLTARSVIDRVHLREALIAEAFASAFASDLQALAGSVLERQEELFQIRKGEMVAAYGMPVSNQQKPFAFSNGIAIIPVHGTLINRFPYSWGYVTGYNFIRQQTALAGQDPDVTGIVYDCNSYGGEAAGCFECSSDIARLANGKPTMTVIDSNCYSGGYAIACGTKRIVLTPSGGAGSVGVVTMHASYAGLLKEAGIKVTFIKAGKHKVDGNPYEDLTPEIEASIQKGIDQCYADFVGLVAKGRKMDDKAVRATEARIYRASEALSLGLIDAVATPQSALQSFMGELSGSNPQLKKEDAMSTTENQPGAKTVTPEDLTKASADATTAERTRVSAILGCDEAKGRAKLANHLAFSTSMSADEAKKMLAAAAAETDAKGNPFEKVMDASEHPNVGAGGNGNGDTPRADRSAEIMKNVKAAGVRGFDHVKLA